MTFGEIPFGDLTFSEVAFGDLIFGEPTGHHLAQHLTGLARTWCVTRKFASDRNSHRALLVSTAFHKDPWSDRCCLQCTYFRSRKLSARSGSPIHTSLTTQLYIALKDDNSTSRLSECFHAVQHWLDLNGLSMNLDKTEAIVIGTSTRKRMEGLVNTVDLGCVSPVSNVWNLGVTIDDTLSFNEHVDNVYKSRADLHWLSVQYRIQYKL